MRLYILTGNLITPGAILQQRQSPFR